jgi:hypothetical protein
MSFMLHKTGHENSSRCHEKRWICLAQMYKEHMTLPHEELGHSVALRALIEQLDIPHILWKPSR